MSRRTRLVHVQDGPERRVVMLAVSPCGAVEACGVPATDWNTWSANERAFVTRLGLVNEGLRRGRSLRALIRHHEAMLSLLEQLEAAEHLAQAPVEGRA